MMVAWGSVAGAVLQILVQLPQTLPLLGAMRLHFSRVRASLRVVFSNLLPVIAGRGVGQFSGYIDNLLASLLPIGAVAAINYAQILYLLPISLFGMSVAAAELPTMSRATAAGKERIRRGLTRPPQLRPAPNLLHGRAVGRRLSFHRRRDRRRCCSSQGNSAMPTRSTYGSCWRARPSACSPPRWAAFTTRHSMRSPIPARRSNSP